MRRGKYFSAGGTLKADARSYIEREADEELYRRLLEGEYCSVLTSRQVGKSSLVVRVEARLRREGVHVARLDLTKVSGTNVTVDQWYSDLIESLGNALGLLPDIQEHLRTKSHISPVNRWHAALRDVVLERLVGPVVVFIDEIDYARSLPFSADEFFANIRSFYNARSEDSAYDRLSFCLVGSAAPTDLIADPRRTPFNVGAHIRLRDFTESEVETLHPGLECPTERAVAMLSRVFYWTNGHPYLTQKLCDQLVLLNRKRREDQEANPPAPFESEDPRAEVDRACEEIFFSRQANEDNFKYIRHRVLGEQLQSSESNEEERMSDLPSVVDEETLIRRLTLYRRSLAGKRVPDDDNDETIASLKLAGLVSSEEDLLVVRNRIYRHVFGVDWIQKNLPDAEERRQKAARRAGQLQILAIALPVLALFATLTTVALWQNDRAQKLAASLKTKTLESDTNAGKYREETATALLQKERADRQTEEAKKQFRLARDFAARANKKEQEANRNLIKARAAEALAQSRGTQLSTALAQSKRDTEAARQERDRTEHLAYDSDMNLAQQYYEFDPPRIAECTRLVENAKHNVARGFEVGYWQHMLHLDLLTLKGHTREVFSVAFSPDGRRIVTGSEDKTAKVWDAATGRETLTLKGHTDRVTSVAFSPDARCIVTGSGDNTAKVWDAATGRETLTLKGHTLKGHTWSVESVAFSPDARCIVTGSEDKTAKVWDAATGRETLTLKGHTSTVTSVAFSPDGRRIVTGSRDKTAKVWDAATGRETLTLKGHTGPVFSVAFSPDGRRIVTGSGDDTAKVWDASTGRETLTLKGHKDRVFSVAFSPDGRRILTGSLDKTAKVWDAATGSETLTLKGHTRDVFSVAFSPDGRRIVTGSEDKTAKVWDAATGSETLTLKGHTNWVSSVAFSPDGRRIVTGSYDKTAKVWDAATGRETLTLKGHTGPVFSVAFSPDGRRIVTGSEDKTAKVWDAATGRETLTLKGHTREVFSVAFSPDGRRIVTGSEDKTAKVWDAATGSETLTLKGHTWSVESVAFSPDARCIVMGSSDKTAQVWDAATGRETLTLKGHTSTVTSVAFSPDGRRIVTGSEDKTAKVWDAATGRVTLTLKGHTDGVLSVAFSPDGRRILTGSQDNTAKVWDAATGRETLELKGHTNWVESVAFSPDARRIVTGSEDKTAKVWLSEL